MRESNPPRLIMSTHRKTKRGNLMPNLSQNRKKQPRKVYQKILHACGVRSCITFRHVLQLSYIKKYKVVLRVKLVHIFPRYLFCAVFIHTLNDKNDFK